MVSIHWPQNGNGVEITETDHLLAVEVVRDGVLRARDKELP